MMIPKPAARQARATSGNVGREKRAPLGCVPKLISEIFIISVSSRLSRRVYGKQKQKQKESGRGGELPRELFKQINQYQRGRKFTADRVAEREREGDGKEGERKKEEDFTEKHPGGPR